MKLKLKWKNVQKRKTLKELKVGKYHRKENVRNVEKLGNK